jgi:predicted pyridoxine 5'-phosphate oxidase superfamily flavin-nucleotide-binding protein
MGNLAQTGEVGMLFIDFEQQRRMRVNGHATVRADDPLLAAFHEAQLIVRVAVREVFGNCPRYIHRMQLVEPSRFVPHSDCETPVPTWKRRIGEELLPSGDPAREAQREALDR